jgi:LytS/YehU family sensor histidine kinase
MLEDQEMRLRFDIQKKALELTELKAANQKKGFIALGFICILLLGISFISYRNYRLKQKANQLLSAEKNRIEIERNFLEEEFVLLQKENLLAKFETLREQINPHFLFNALNSLYALVDKDAKKSKEFIKEFSLMYRKVLEFNDLTVITLKKEIEFVNHYLYLQKIRFGDNLKVHVHIHSVLNNFFLPPFSLQILIENAVKHNEVSSDFPLNIEINTDLESKTLRVVNSLNTRKESVVQSTGTGLNNIIKRYQILSELTPEFIVQQKTYIAILPLLEEEL